MKTPTTLRSACQSVFLLHSIDGSIGEQRNRRRNFIAVMRNQQEGAGKKRKRQRDGLSSPLLFFALRDELTVTRVSGGAAQHIAHHSLCLKHSSSLTSLCALRSPLRRRESAYTLRNITFILTNKVKIVLPVISQPMKFDNRYTRYGLWRTAENSDQS